MLEHKRRRVILVTAALMLFMGLFPPWIQTQTLRTPTGAGGVVNEHHVYGLLFSPPDPRPMVSGSPYQIQPLNTSDLAASIRHDAGRAAEKWPEDRDLVQEFVRLNWASLSQFQHCIAGEVLIQGATPEEERTVIPFDKVKPVDPVNCGFSTGRSYDLSGFRLPGGRSLPKYGSAIGWQTRLDIGRLLLQSALVLIAAAVICWLLPASTAGRPNPNNG